MTEYIHGLLLTYVAFTFAVLSPGPNVFGVLNVSLEKGKAAGTLFGIGIAFGSLTWATLSVLGLTQFISQYAVLLLLLKVFGGLYLIYLALKAYISSKTTNKGLIPDIDPISTRYFTGGYALMMTNPKAALAWVVIVSLSTYSDAPIWVPMAAIAGTFVLSILIHVAYATVFSNGSFVSFYRRSRSRILKVFAFIYVGLGLKLLASAN